MGTVELTGLLMMLTNARGHALQMACVRRVRRAQAAQRAACTRLAHVLHDAGVDVEQVVALHTNTRACEQALYWRKTQASRTHRHARLARHARGNNHQVAAGECVQQLRGA
jgi:hypothetical protein